MPLEDVAIGEGSAISLGLETSGEDWGRGWRWLERSEDLDGIVSMKMADER